MYTDNNRPNDPSISPNNTIKGKAEQTYNWLRKVYRYL